MKPKVAIHSITGCAGCQLTIYFIQDHLLELLSHIDLVAAPMIQSKNSDGPYDITFLEGSITTEDDLKKAKELRKKSTILIALGTCAAYGCIQSTKQFNKYSKDMPNKIYRKTDHLKSIESTGLNKHIEVDYTLLGCPPDKNEIVNFIKDLLIGKKPEKYVNPVCYECSIKENVCLLEIGKECLGPLTNGACNALCPSNNHGCTGCRGPIEDLNYSTHKELIKRLGITSELFKQRIIKYAPKEYMKLIKKLNC